MDNIRISGLMSSMVYTTQPPAPPKFEDVDADQDGSITKTEFQSSLENLPHPGSAPDVDEIFSRIDADEDGFINPQEMQAAGERLQVNMGDGTPPSGGSPSGESSPGGAAAGGSPPGGGAPGAGASAMTGTEEEDDDTGVYYDPLDTNKDGVVDISEMIAAGLMGSSQESQYGSYSLPAGSSQTGSNLIDLIA